MTNEKYPKGLRDKIRNIRTTLDEKIYELAAEYPGVISAEKIKRDLLCEQQKVSPTSRSTPQEDDSEEDASDEKNEVVKEQDATRHFKNQCRRLYDLSVKLYHEDGIHILSYCSPAPEQMHVRPLKVFNTKLCKRFHSKLLSEQIRISDDLRDYIVDHSSNKKKKRVVEDSKYEQLSRKKKRTSKEPAKKDKSKEPLKTKEEAKPPKQLKLNTQTKLNTFFKRATVDDDDAEDSM